MNLRSQYELDLTTAVSQHVEAIVAYVRKQGGTISPLDMVQATVDASRRLLSAFDAAPEYRQYDLLLDLASKVGRNDQFGADPTTTPEV